jgi:signal transduction histidine kinase
VALAGVAAGTAWERVRVWRARTAVARLVVDASRTSPGGLRDALAAMLGDPSLAVLFPLGDGRSVDAHGRPAEPGPGQAVTRLRQGGTEVALLAHRDGLLDDPGLADGITSLARLALHTERLRAETLVQLADLRASRARIVDVGDAERRRLERDLHDGVQQRLVALALSIRLARMRDGSDERLARAEEEVRGALGELREIAHGLWPPILAEEGLAAGLEALAEGLPVRLRLDGLSGRRFDRSIESAAYLVVAETVKRSGCTEATVRMSDGGERLMIEMHAGGVGAVTDLQDRVGAVNGSLRVDGSVLRAEFPCG